ncbi:hypothetical protein [Candidatus Methanarcanum hacksteinii]|uniref:hypothetical protein n=1 Tax=Candidatus Methanarcanum hacksteinii TaxID=2911857 RepID=UPI0037DC51D2
MTVRDKLVPEPIFNILNLGQIDVDALEKDYNWSVIKCTDWDVRNRIVREIKPAEGILAIKSEDNDGKNIYVMSKITKDELQSKLEDEFGKDKLKQMGSIYKMNNYEMVPYRIVQLLLNSMNKKSLFMETNAEGHFFMVLDKIHTKDVPEPLYGQLLVMMIEAVAPPECMTSFGSVMIKYSLRTLNNTLRDAVHFDPKKWKYAVYRFDETGIHTGMPFSDGNMFIYKAVYNEKAHLDLLNWGSSKDEKKLNQSRSVKVYEILKRLKKRYGKYLGDFSFAKCEGESLKDDTKKIYHDRLIGHFQNREVRIFNCTGPENKELVDEFVKAAESTYQFKVKRATGPGIAGYNVPIIFDEDYYKEKGIPDPHNQPTVGITQFAVIDTIKEIMGDFGTNYKSYQTRLNNYEEKKKEWCSDKVNKGKKYPKSPPSPVIIPEVEAIFEQLFIKEDLESDMVSFYHWAAENYPGDWTFARPIKHKEKGKKRKVLDGFACLTIKNDGRIVDKGFFSPADPFGPSPLTSLDWEKISYAVINPAGDINLVTQTDASTITDGLSIKRMIEANNNKVAEYEEKTKDWTEEQKEADRKNRPQRAEGIATWETKLKYMGGCIGVGYYRLSPDRWIYYVGAQDNPNQAITNASTVYLIESVNGSDIFFDDLFPMMAVPFVKHNQNTVIPFPIKYLTEWYKKEHPEWRD